jgi:hypothetical protein
LFYLSKPAGIKKPPDSLRRVYDIFKLLHIIFRSPEESNNENDDDVIEMISLFEIVNVKIAIF